MLKSKPTFHIADFSHRNSGLLTPCISAVGKKTVLLLGDTYRIIGTALVPGAMFPLTPYVTLNFKYCIEPILKKGSELINHDVPTDHSGFQRLFVFTPKMF